jgi:glycosyltransferase involved in cell wall biosynthesis
LLAILTSHPIQYQVPIWRALTGTKIPFQVWYLTRHGVEVTRDREFNCSFAWDLDSLAGYPHVFLDIDPDWRLDRFRGIQLRESLDERIYRDDVRAIWIEGWRFQANWTALGAARRAGTRTWLRGESNVLKCDSVVKSIVKRPLLKRFFRRVDEFLCIGAANQQLYESYGVPRHKLHCTPYCVDNDRFTAEAQNLRLRRPGIRRKWKIAEDSFCVLFCGKFIPKKRPIDLVRAVERISAISRRERDIHILFVGSGELGPELRSACEVTFDADAELEPGKPRAAKPKASFAGFLNQLEVAEAYVAADLVVLPSDNGETWGLVANEAMACGTPVVSSNQCGCSIDLVAALDRRFVFQCGDVNSLATAITHAMKTKHSEVRLREIVDTHHLRHTVDTVSELYEALPK